MIPPPIALIWNLKLLPKRPVIAVCKSIWGQIILILTCFGGGHLQTPRTWGLQLEHASHVLGYVLHHSIFWRGVLKFFGFSPLPVNNLSLYSIEPHQSSIPISLTKDLYATVIDWYVKCFKSSDQNIMQSLWFTLSIIYTVFPQATATKD